MAGVRRFARPKTSGRAALPLVLLLVVTLAAGVISPSASPWRDAARALEAAAEQARADAPDQVWGSAEGNPAELGGPGTDHGEPRSERSRYAQPEFAERPVPRPNKAAAGVGTTKVTGYDPRRSTERADLRASHKRTYLNPDGTETTQFSTQPLNYRDKDGTWRPIDAGLVPAPGGGWKNQADEVGIEIAGSSGAPRLATVRLGDGQEVSYGLRGARDVPGRVDGGAVRFSGVADDVDLELRPQPGGLKELLVLRTPDAQRRWVFPLRLTGLTAQLARGGVALLDRRGAEVAHIPPGYLTDAEGATSFGVAYRLVEDGSALEVSVDDAWLDDPAREYPVAVDPTVRGDKADRSMYVHGANQVSGTGELWVGDIAGANAAAYVAFDGIENALRNHRIFGAQLQLVNYDASSCRPAPVAVHAVAESWPAATAPRVDATALASKSFAHGYIAVGQSSSACPAGAELINLGTRGQQLVQRWVKHQQPNHGLALRASGPWKKFTATGTANPPTLFVTHSPYDAKYKIVQPIPDPPVTTVQPGQVKITVTNASSMPWTKGDFALGYRAFAEGGALKATKKNAAELPHDVPVGASVALTATIDKFAQVGGYVLDFSMLRRGPPEVFFTDEQVAPARISLHVFNVPPVVKFQYPPSGHSVETLTPQLWAQAQDHENDPLRYRFKVCPVDALGNPVSCFDSGLIDKPYWTIPQGRLRWSEMYLWAVFAHDGTGESEHLAYSALLTSVPQPEVTSRLGNAPYTGGELGFDPLLGNYSTAAVDASVASAGPQLAVARTYNSLDPRTDLAFGVGWSSQYDTGVKPDADGSGNVLVTYPDGQQVRFGRNPDGGYAPPSGRFATLTALPPAQNGGWALTDKDRSVYTFRSDGKLVSIRDSAGRVLEFAYGPGDTLATAVDRTSGRALEFTWTGAHVTRVRTDAVDGTRLAWDYVYDGHRLLEVCNPQQRCTRYQYETGSHYRTVTLDSRPESYWRLGEGAGPAAGSQVASKASTDNATYVNVNHGYGPDALAASEDAAIQLTGTGSYVQLPDRTLHKHRDVSVELWFKTASAGPLVGYQNKALGETSASGVPMLYVGGDGKLRGQFWTGAVNPITSAAAVNDGQWHHVVLSGSLATQALYLDGVKVGTREGVIDHAAFEFAQVGAAYVVPTFPGIPTGRRFIAAEIDELAYYARPLGDHAVAAHYAARLGGDQLTQVRLPGGQIAAEVGYDAANDRMREFTDANGGRWTLDVPTVGGSKDNPIRTVGVIDPSGRPRFYDYDALKGRVLRQATPVGTTVRPEDVLGGNCETGEDGVIRCGSTIIALGVRLFEYDAEGFQTTITDELGKQSTLVHDERGNLTVKTTCRAPQDCQTTRYTYQPPTGDPTDPRTDRLIEVRDARSSGPTDDRYLTRSTYTAFGDLATETGPDGGATTHTYTDGTSAAVGGGVEPARLLAATIDPNGAATRNRYYANGDLAETTTPAGFRTTYQYDELGRLTAETDYPDGVPDGVTTRYAYDTLGRVVEVVEPGAANAVTGVVHANRTTTEYDANGSVIKVEEHDSADPAATRTLTYGYDQHNRLVRVVGPGGDEVSYGYDQFGNRVWAVDPHGVRTEYRYTARNKIAEVRLSGWHGKPITPGADAPDEGEAADLVLESSTYDHAGRLVRQVDAMGRKTEFTYFDDGLVAKVIAADVADPVTGGTRDVLLQDNTYDAAGNLVRQVGAGGSVVTHEHDAVGRLKATTLDPGGLRRRTEYRYDLGGNVLQVARSGAHSNTGSFGPSFAAIVDYGYDLFGRQTSETVRSSAGTSKTTTAYNRRDQITRVVSPLGNAAGADPAAHATDYRYDELGRLVAEISPPVDVEQGGGAPVRTRPEQTTGYNAFGEVTEQRNARGEVSRSVYDKRGYVVRAEEPGYTPPGGAAPVVPVSTAVYDASGRPTEVTDATGAVTRYRYDQRGRLVEQRDPDPADPAEPGGLWRYEYTHTDQVLAVVDPSGARTEATYDAFDRPVTRTLIERKPTPGAHTTRLTYDDAGNVLTSTSPTGSVTRATYDALGQRTKVTDPAGVATQFGYDSFGNQVWQKDGKGRTSYAKLDQGGNVVNEFDFAPAGSLLARRSYTYDLAGNVLTATDALGKVTRFGYDAGGAMTRRVEPVAADHDITTTFGYDALGRTSRVTDGRGNSTVYTYNALGLTESVIEPATAAHPSPGDRTWTATYDAAGQAVAMAAPGGVVRAREYDGLGRMVRETGSGAEAATAERTASYDPMGRVVGLSAPGGFNTYDYNDRGQLLSAEGPSGDSSFAYDADGRMVSRSDAAGTTGFTYLDGRLSSIQDGVAGATSTLGYTTAGELDTIGYGGGVVRKFGYDDLGREISDVTKDASNAVVASTAYAYDLNHRLTRKTTVGTASAGEETYAYDHLGRMTSWTAGGTVKSYQWDDSGNRTRDGDKTATYDERNRLLGDGDYTYGHTPRGTTASRTSSGHEERFDFDAFDRLVQVGATALAYDGLDRPVTRGAQSFRYAGSETDPVADGAAVYGRGAAGELLSLSQGADRRVLLSDRHGDVIGGFAPGTAALADSASFGPFGEPRAATGAQRAVGYQGDWTDPDTGQVNMGARWYDPSSGRFTSRDTLAQAGPGSTGLNRYGYAVGSPMNYGDPDGHEPRFVQHHRPGGDGTYGTWTRPPGALPPSPGRAVLPFLLELIPGKSVYDCVKGTASCWWVLTEIPIFKLAKVGKAGKGAKAGRHVGGAAKTYRSTDGAIAAFRMGERAFANSMALAKKLPPGPLRKAAEAAAHAGRKAAQSSADVAAAARAVTAQAKAAVAQVVKKNPLPPLKAALKPAMANPKHLVSAVPNAPARVVQHAVSNVQDLNRVYDKIKESLLGAGAEVVQEAVQATAVEIVAGSGDPMLLDLLPTGGKRRTPSAKGHTARSTTSPSCSAQAKANLNSNSFTAETPVLLADGTRKPISDVAVGDHVLATDPTTGESGPRVVTDVRSHQSERLLYAVTVETETGTGTITATDEHPFWVKSLQRWVNAEDLKPGYTFETADHRPATVTGITPLAERRQVYNLTVDGLHTYYVAAGDFAILVHNADSECTVGRWMADVEYEAMRTSGKVQAGSGGATTYVISPSDPAPYRKQAKPGTLYVEFDVPCSCLKPAGDPRWAQIPGPTHPIYANLNKKRGLAPPTMPSFRNLKVVERK